MLLWCMVAPPLSQTTKMMHSIHNYTDNFIHRAAIILSIKFMAITPSDVVTKLPFSPGNHAGKSNSLATWDYMRYCSVEEKLGIITTTKLNLYITLGIVNGAIKCVGS